MTSEQAPKEFRGGTRFVQYLRAHPEDVRRAASSAYGGEQEQPKMSMYESAATGLGIFTVLRMGRIHKATPDWMDRRGVTSTAKELFSSKVWEPLVEDAPIEVRRALKRQVLAVTNSGAASEIAIINSRLGTSHVAAALLGAGIGRPIEDTWRGPRREQDPFVQELGYRYPEPAQTPEEFLARVQELFPNPDEPHDASKTLIRILFDNKRFKSHKKMCPAPSLTDVLFEEWGRSLDTNPTHRERFLATVQK